MVLTAIFFSHLSNLIHERNEYLNWEQLIEFKVVLSINVLDQEPVLFIQGLVSNDALIDPEVCGLDQALEEHLVHLLATLFI